MNITSIVWLPSQFMDICLTQKYFQTWMYPIPGPDRAHRHKQNCIYPQLFGFKPVLRTYAWHTTSSIIEYIPPPLGPTGPRDRKTKLHISTIVWLQISFLKIYFAHNILYNWIYWYILNILIYSITEDVVCQAYAYVSSSYLTRGLSVSSKFHFVPRFWRMKTSFHNNANVFSL